jgi:hypothetical protein
MHFADHEQPDQNQVAEGNQITQAHVNRLITFLVTNYLAAAYRRRRIQ